MINQSLPLLTLIAIVVLIIAVLILVIVVIKLKRLVFISYEEKLIKRVRLNEKVSEKEELKRKREDDKKYKIEERYGQNNSEHFLSEGNYLNIIAEEEYLAGKVLKFCNEDDAILDKEFRIRDLARVIGTNRNYISRAINRALQLNFNQFKNYMRIYKTCSYFISHPKTNLSQLFEISQFTSLTTFNYSFDKYTNFSPNRWCRDVLQRLENGERVSVHDYIREIKIKNYYDL